LEREKSRLANSGGGGGVDGGSGGASPHLLPPLEQPPNKATETVCDVCVWSKARVALVPQDLCWDPT
jgi:hypothetical protein